MKTGTYRPADLNGDRGQPDHVIDGIGARIGVRLNAQARCTAASRFRRRGHWAVRSIASHESRALGASAIRACTRDEDGRLEEAATRVLGARYQERVRGRVSHRAIGATVVAGQGRSSEAGLGGGADRWRFHYSVGKPGPQQGSAITARHVTGWHAGPAVLCSSSRTGQCLRYRPIAKYRRASGARPRRW